MNNQNSFKIVSQPDNNNPFLVLYKPKNIPSAPIKVDDTNNALNYATKLFPEIKNVCGKKQIEYGLIHRIDTVTEGLLLIATTQDAYDFFIEQQEKNNFIKYYKAECEFNKNIQQKILGYPICQNFPKVENFINTNSPYINKIQIEQQSYFRPFGKGRKEVRPVVQNDKTAALNKATKKLYTTKISIAKENNLILIDAKITNGYRHQVRSHLAWCGLPIKNDPVYNPNFSNQEHFKFAAYKLEFIHPLTKKTVIVE